MQCVRCLNDTASKVADAPDGSGAWEIYYCETCRYSWRSCEEDYIVDVAKRNPKFQINENELKRIISTA